MSEFNGISTLILIIFLIFSVCAVFCYLRTLRRRHMQQNAQRRSGSHSMVYSVTMQEGNSGSFYNSVTEYLRNTAGQSSSTSNEHFENGKVITPVGLPSYDDVISGKFDGNIERPPPYSETQTSNLDSERGSSVAS
ncbi:uncharacterized protein LOC123529799 [Mercenaria mercenaria]|uniref:uncharacterized protein LOC123529799 n=1 Tax=Mercenaria mercenaria TaxID=6596 RepID=UPI00234F9822|nr:uncharacterized protein LOC123529799 [Mercenaria mercenaria]